MTLDDTLRHPWPEERGDRGAFDVVGSTPEAPKRPARSCAIHSDCDAADPGEPHISGLQRAFDDRIRASLGRDADEQRRRIEAEHTALQAKGDPANPKDRIGATKPPLHLVPAALSIYASQAMKDGARKYGPFNWREHPVKAEVYVSAAMRHLASWFDGEEVAEDSGQHHLAHAAACLGILLDAMATGNLIDDRPTPGPAARLIAEMTETRSA